MDLDVATSVSRCGKEDTFENEEFLTVVKDAYQELAEDNEEIAKVLKNANPNGYSLNPENPTIDEETRNKNIKEMAEISKISQKISDEQYNDSEVKKSFIESFKKKLKSENTSDSLDEDKIEEIANSMWDKIGKYKGISI